MAMTTISPPLHHSPDAIIKRIHVRAVRRPLVQIKSNQISNQIKVILQHIYDSIYIYTGRLYFIYMMQGAAWPYETVFQQHLVLGYESREVAPQPVLRSIDNVSGRSVLLEYPVPIRIQPIGLRKKSSHH